MELDLSTLLLNDLPFMPNEIIEIILTSNRELLGKGMRVSKEINQLLTPTVVRLKKEYFTRPLTYKEVMIGVETPKMKKAGLFRKYNFDIRVYDYLHFYGITRKQPVDQIYYDEGVWHANNGMIFWSNFIEQLFDSNQLSLPYYRMIPIAAITRKDIYKDFIKRQIIDPTEKILSQKIFDIDELFLLYFGVYRSKGDGRSDATNHQRRRKDCPLKWYNSIRNDIRREYTIFYRYGECQNLEKIYKSFNNIGDAFLSMDFHIFMSEDFEYNEMVN